MTLATSYVHGADATPLRYQTIGAALVALMFSMVGGRATVWSLGLAAGIALVAAVVSYSRRAGAPRAKN